MKKWFRQVLTGDDWFRLEIKKKLKMESILRVKKAKKIPP